jgi:DNA helicase-2/ATP-dependent DNA helicase PcrA
VTEPHVVRTPPVGDPPVGAPLVSADEIADALRRPRPTAQQREVIESALEPALVVAGAGSGKTETMANRVLWLLANGRVQAGQILGLTFTRKAAGELSARIRERIAELHCAGLLTEDYDEFDPPAVATYNSFSNRIYRDNAILLGRESDGPVLGEASAWQLARSIVVASTDDRLPALDRSVDSVTKAVLALAHAVSENVVDPADVAAFATRFAALADLPAGGRGAYEDAAVVARTVGALPVLLDLAGRFVEAKARRGFVEYSDQVALALQIVRDVPRVADELREQYRVVLLDEYQDTSVVQTWLLSELFARTPVMAVGDPNQSIYGWRGASAANLDGFARQFGGAPGRTGSRQCALTTSWRNGHDILAVANAIVEPFRSGTFGRGPFDAGTRTTVDRLEAGPSASALPVEVVVEETLPDEAEAAALWLKARLAVGSGQPPPTAAMLFRARKTQGAFIDALRRHGVPFHVLGLGGLMAEPEVADLVSALAVVNDPTAGSELVRLLAGSRWRIGAKDLHGLGRLASWLRDRDYAQRALADEVKEKLRASVSEAEGGSIVDALDFIGTARPGHSQLERFSAVGVERLRDAARTFARLRARAGLDLLDFVTFVEQDLMLDIEVAANETRSLGAANMEAFFDALGGYLAVDDSASLGGFLAWLREAEWRDNLSPRPEDPEPGTVQLLTIHGSKGLEWDLVVVPRLVEGELPGSPREGSNGWLSFGTLPYDFRGDAQELPVFDWASATTRKELLDSQKTFKAAVRERHDLEERRLAYVAVTRARHSLLLTASFWATQSSARRPSPFLRELEAGGVIGELPVESEHAENPLGAEASLFSWPMDPLGGRRAVVERAAVLVRDALCREASPGDAGQWGAELELLLEERRRRIDASGLVELPTRVPASRFKDFVSDPASVAASLRRPMPERPYRATRLGTLFHEWVEQRYGAHGMAEELDALPTELDGFDDESAAGAMDPEGLATLRATFERSEFATLTPEEVEIEIHLILDGEVIVCKLDAVYLIDGRYRVVDWKTGAAPKDADDLESKQLQLALYRQAFAEWKGIDPELIDAVFYYVSDDRVIRPERIYGRDELMALWRGIAR